MSGTYLSRPLSDLCYRDFVDGSIGSNFVHMHLRHDPIPTVPPYGFLDYTHPSGEIFDPFTFDLSATNETATRDGSTAVFCPGRENEVSPQDFDIHMCPSLSMGVCRIALREISSLGTVS